MKKFISVVLIVSLALLSASCAKKKDDKKRSPTEKIFSEMQKPVTRENYLNGKSFCSVYGSITAKEYGRYIKVPINYENPKGGSIEIYTWTNRRFNPSLPSVVFVDGGPGQNSHGFPNALDSGWNEIHFDQRGLGCSAPETYELYKDVSLYSTKNNVLDMDEIRKSYKIKAWSIYGISYGTVPATIYGSRFPDTTVAVTLEGVVNSPSDIGSPDWYVEKWNLVLSNLNSAQVNAFAGLLTNEKYVEAILYMMSNLIYQDMGLQKTLSYLQSFINSNGSVNYSTLDGFQAKLIEMTEDGSPYAQKPMDVDSNILNIIYCKDLGADLADITYDFNLDINRFITRYKESDKTCDDLNIPKNARVPYNALSYPNKKPVSYFQGSHDGATLARGAYKHFMSVPQSTSNFVLNQKGGHNPITTSIIDKLDDDDDRDLLMISAHRKVFTQALSGGKISNADISILNRTRSDLGLWVLFEKGINDSPRLIDKELAGIKRAK